MGLLKAYIRHRRDPRPPPSTGPFHLLHLRTGALVDIDEGPFLILPDTAKVQHPGKGTSVRLATEFGLLGARVQRFYLQPVPGREIPETILQVSTDSEGVDYMVLSQAYEVLPGTAEEWDEWTSDKKGLLGSDLLNTPDGIEFTRVWGPTGTWHPPEQVVERTEQGGRCCERSVALYNRQIGMPPYLRFLDAAKAPLQEAINHGAPRSAVEEILESVNRLTPTGDMPEELLMVEGEFEKNGKSRIVLYAGLQVPASAVKVV